MEKKADAKKKKEKDKKRSTKKSRKDDEEDDDPIARAKQARERAELDLIVGNSDLDGEREHAFNMKHVDLGKKKRKNKSRKKQMEEDEDSDGGADGDDGFRIDTKCACAFTFGCCCRRCPSLPAQMLMANARRVCATPASCSSAIVYTCAYTCAFVSALLLTRVCNCVIQG